MIEILDSAKHVVAMKVSGSLTAEDITKAYNVTQSVLEGNERVAFFVEIDNSVSFTLEGIYRDIVEGLGHFGKLSRYYRAAVVTDRGWIGALARVEGVVFSSIDVRVFGPSERDKAFTWVSEAPEPVPEPEQPKRSIHFLQTTSERVFAYEVNGRVREKDVKAVVNEMKPYIENESQFNILARMKNLSGFDILAMLDDDLLKMKYSAFSKVNRYAVVSGKSWMRNLLELAAPMFKTELRVFDLEDESTAWEWVGAQQALLHE